MENPAWARVTAELEARRARNEQENQRRQAEIAQKSPALDALLKARHSLVMGAVRGAFSGAAVSDPEAAMAEYNRRIADLLAENGYPRDYLAPVCQCPLCGDAGYVYDGGVQKRCECANAAYQKALAQEDGGGSARESFAAFDFSRFPDSPLPGTDVTQRQYMGTLREKCLQYAKAVGSGPCKTLLLHGGSGLGKTYLLRCVGREAQARGVEPLFVTAYDLLMALKAAFFSRAGEGAEAYFDAPLLLVDDLGMEPLMENITVEQLYHLLNTRLARGLYTAFTTNLSLTELKNRYTERFTSRLLDTRAALSLAFLGQDIRLLKNR